MLHLLPVRLILKAIAALVAIAVLTASYAGWVGNGGIAHDMAAVTRWSSSLATAAIILLYVSWRWVPTVQLSIFPYLGGRWSGVLCFTSKHGPEHRDVHLEIKHTLFDIKLFLDSNESTSSTLVVHAERNPDFQRYRIFYVYLNERKEGVEGAGVRYRGLAVMRVEWGPQPELQGDYFTETNSSGTLHLKRDEGSPWWKLWR